MASTGEAWRLGRRPALDGLRGIAVVLVVLDHGFPAYFTSAGSVGVIIFFTLSGFLITALLLEERETHGTIDVRAFYVRRARRLLPALFVFLVASAIGQALTDLPIAPPFAVGAAALYVANWLAAQGVTMGGLSHTWSLSVEEQFYLGFPLLVLAMSRRAERTIMNVCVAGVLASLSARVGWWALGEYGRSYYGLESNAAAILAGCALAVWIRAGGTSPRRLGFAAVAGLLALSCLGRGSAGWFYAPTLAIPLAVLAVATAGTGTPEQIPVPLWLRGVGRRSYGLYLWHYPLLWIISRHLPGAAPVNIAAMIGLSWLLAVLSWRYVETPFLRNRQWSARIGKAAEPHVTSV